MNKNRNSNNSYYDKYFIEKMELNDRTGVEYIERNKKNNHNKINNDIKYKKLLDEIKLLLNKNIKKNKSKSKNVLEKATFNEKGGRNNEKVNKNIKENKNERKNVLEKATLNIKEEKNKEKENKKNKIDLKRIVKNRIEKLSKGKINSIIKNKKYRNEKNQIKYNDKIYENEKEFIENVNGKEENKDKGKNKEIKNKNETENIEKEDEKEDQKDEEKEEEKEDEKEDQKDEEKEEKEKEKEIMLFMIFKQNIDDELVKIKKSCEFECNDNEDIEEIYKVKAKNWYERRCELIKNLNIKEEYKNKRLLHIKDVFEKNTYREDYIPSLKYTKEEYELKCKQERMRNFNTINTDKYNETFCGNQDYTSD
jgi:hypothetical protein